MNSHDDESPAALREVVPSPSPISSNADGPLALCQGFLADDRSGSETPALSLTGIITRNPENVGNFARKVVRPDYLLPTVLWWSYAEAAARSGLSLRTLYNLSQRGAIRTCRRGAYRVDRVSLERYLLG